MTYRYIVESVGTKVVHLEIPGGSNYTLMPGVRVTFSFNSSDTDSQRAVLFKLFAYKDEGKITMRREPDTVLWGHSEWGILL